MVGGRLLAGLWTLRRWTRAAREVDAPEWRAALARAGGDALGIRLLASEDASSPLSWGWRRPVILLDRDTLRSPGEADAILAHEVAHVARRDWPSLILSRLAVALFWFNPLVWRLDREVAQQAEEAADSDAAAAVEPARYAQTLLDWARLSGANALPANAIAAGEPGLSKRVKAILDGRVSRRSGSFWAVAAMLGCAAFAAPVAALDFVEGAPEAPPLRAGRRRLRRRWRRRSRSRRCRRRPGAAPHAGPAPHAPLAADGACRAPRRAGAARPCRMPPSPRRRGPAPTPAPRPDAAGRPCRRSGDRGARSRPRWPRRRARSRPPPPRSAAPSSARSKRPWPGWRRARAAWRMAPSAWSAAPPTCSPKPGGCAIAAYREEQIRKAAARGKRLTHEELLEAAEGMEEGAEGMREGAREMREAAADMRKGRHD